MRLGMRFGLSAIEKRDVWSRWKAGQSLHEIGRAFDRKSERFLAMGKAICLPTERTAILRRW